MALGSAIDTRRARPHHFRKQTFFAAEMAVKGLFRGAGARGDDLHRRLGKAEFKKHAFGDGGDLFAPFLAARNASAFLHFGPGEVG